MGESASSISKVCGEDPSACFDTHTTSAPPRHLSKSFRSRSNPFPGRSSHKNPMPSLIHPLLRTTTPACHPPHLNPAPIKSHSQWLPSSRCIESAHALQWDSCFLAVGASDTALGLVARGETL